MLARVSGDAEYQSYWHQQGRDESCRKLKTTCFLVLVLESVFVALDAMAYRENLAFFFSMRALTCALVLLILFRLRFVAPKLSEYAITFSVGGHVLAMVHATGGAGSAYYPGLIILFVGMPVMQPLTARDAAICSGTLSIAYLATPLFGTGVDLRDFSVHGVFVLSGAFESVVSCGLLTSSRLQDWRQRRQLEAAHARLEETDKAKSRFTANVHHELRTPLTLMLAPLEAMRSGDFGELPGRIDATLRTMQTNGLRLLKLINNLLDLAKVESEQLRVRRVRMDLGRLVEEVVDGARPMAERKGLSLEVEIGAGVEPVCVDPDALEKVLVNLVGNALKFTSEGSVRVVLEGEAEGVHLRVVDTGAGIPEDQLARVFDRFAQVDASATRRHEGTGIGLSLVHELVRLHGGRVWAESEGAGHGASLHVALPRGESDAEEDEEVLLSAGDGRAFTAEGSFAALAAEMAEELDAADAGRFTELERTAERHEGQLLPAQQTGELPAHPPGTPEVVVADDNLEMRRLLAFLIGREFVVRPCRNGREALEAVREREPALVVTDVMMPEMSGTELCRAIKEDPEIQAVPVMLVTSKAEREMKIEGLELGAEDYVTKPFHPRELLARVRSLVRIRQLQREIEAQNASLEAGNRELAAALRDLQEAEVQLVQAERFAAVGELAAGVAHEVNNPLNFARNSLAAIRSAVDDMRGLLGRVAQLDASDPARLAAQLEELERKRAELGGEELAGELAELVGIVSGGLDRTSRLVGDLRDFASPHRGRRSPVEVVAGLRSTLELFGHRLRESGIEVELEAAEALPYVEGDPGALNQVFLNLLKNAAEAIEEQPGGRIRVSARSEGDALVVRFRDDGPGIAAEDRERLFEPFFTTKPAGQGTGLGLAICRRIVMEHGGTIAIGSEPGEGTEVVVRLPVRMGPGGEGGVGD